MMLAMALLLAPALLGVEPSSTDTDSDAAMRAHWREVFDGIAEDYKLVRLSDQETLKLVDRATYAWARSGPHLGTYGCVYVWTYRGNAEAVACFWRNPGANGSVSVTHELHSLSPDILDSQGTGTDSWKPKAAVKRYPLPNAPEPAATAVGRMQQMRTFCRDFTSHSVGVRGDRTELRLLPQPLYRSQSTNPDIVDGAVFAFVCSVGTDPEVFLQLEAIKTEDGPRWHYTLGRFSHMDLFVEYQGKEVWRALRDADNPMSHNADHTYWVFGQRFDREELDGPPKR